ncbi:MarR family winged helix-turn-helix transcriptional regulator [Rubrivivax sp. RP6-9]|uniref:MarR family winged helix-turn-helix transcriptional regulator n=1 Tax=Rubrivivax sp. RP6-9 TaxID=3415750 RepID=UPI003CC53520
MPSRDNGTSPPASAPDAVPRGCTNLKLRQASRLVTRHYERFVAPTGLKITQYSLLSHVVKLGPLRAGALAAAMQLEASTLTRNLQPLLQQGLVQMRTGDDARSRVVEATAAGRALREQAQRAWKRAQSALNERLGSARVAALHALIDECLPLLETDAPHPEDTPHG